MLHKFSFMNSPGQILTKRGGGETKLLLERDQKRDQATKQSLKIFFWVILSSVEHKKHQSRFFTRATPLVATKMVNFAPKRNARYTSGIPFATLLSFFYPYPLSLYGRSAFGLIRWRQNQIFLDPQVLNFLCQFFFASRALTFSNY